MTINYQPITRRPEGYVTQQKAQAEEHMTAATGYLKLGNHLTSHEAFSDAQRECDKALEAISILPPYHTRGIRGRIAALRSDISRADTTIDKHFQ